MRVVATLGALIVGAALALQLWILVDRFTADGGSVLAGAWRFLAYFTILTNCLVCAVLTRAALAPGDGASLNAPRVELTALASILSVGAVYHVLLASRWDPQGLQKLADVALHTLAPVVFAAFWLLRPHPHPRLRWRDAVFTALWPVGYCVYGLARGAFDGFYPYFFMDPSSTPWPNLALNVAGLAGLFVLAALALAALDGALSRRGAAARPQN